MEPDHHHRASFAAVDISAQIAQRPAPPRDETPELLALTQTIAQQPETTRQALVDCVLKLHGAQSAGISVVDTEGGEEVFRWVAIAGRLAPHRGTTLPRWFSPCGDVLRTGRLLLMSNPAVHYPYAADLGPMAEVLLSPLWKEDVAVGTVWVVVHDGPKRFDAEDARILTSLTRFVSSTSDLLDRLSFGVTL